MRQSQQQKVGSNTTPQSAYFLMRNTMPELIQKNHYHVHTLKTWLNQSSHRVSINIFNKLNYILMGSQYPNPNNNTIRTKFKLNTIGPHLEPCNLPHVCCNTTFLFFHYFTWFSLFYYFFLTYCFVAMGCYYVPSIDSFIFFDFNSLKANYDHQ